MREYSKRRHREGKEKDQPCRIGRGSREEAGEGCKDKGIGSITQEQREKEKRKKEKDEGKREEERSHRRSKREGRR